MASDSQSPEARELTLIGKVEFRIAMADSDEKLQSLLQTYLPPLLLKLASDSVAVRNKVISVCQHVNTRVKAPSIQLPVAALLKQFKEQKSQLVRHFDLIYAQQGIDRLGSGARVDLLLPLLQGISEIGTSVTQGAIVFNLVLRLLPLFKLPAKGSEEDQKLKERLGLSDEDSRFLSFWLSKLLLLSPAPAEASSCPGLSPDEYKFLNKDEKATETWNPALSGGLNLTETKVVALRFLGSGAFADTQKFVPSLIASADANSRLADLGDETLKRFAVDLEDSHVVEQLYDLYFGADGAPPVRLPVQVKILVYLGKSIRATANTERIFKLIEDGLLSDAARSAQGLQAAKLRTQIFTFTTWVVRMGSPSDLRQIAPKLIAGLRDFIQSQGWPSPGASGQKLPATDLSLRGLAYESIGILVPKVDFQLREDTVENFEFDLVRWLFISLSADDSSPQIFVSIDQALGSILNSSLDSHDQEFQGQLRPFLVRQMGLQTGDIDPETEFTVARGVQYAAVRYANRFLPYNDVVARWIDLMAIARGPGRQQEIVEEGKKGLHPYWFRLLNPTKDQKWATTSEAQQKRDESWFEFPHFDEATRFLLGSDDVDSSMDESSSTPRLLSGPYKDAFAPAVAFLRNTLLWEAFSAAGIVTDMEQDWDFKLEVHLSTNAEARTAVRKYIRDSAKESVFAYLSGLLDGLEIEGLAGLRQCGVHFVEVCSLAPDDVVERLTPRAQALNKPILSNNEEIQTLAARAFGILVSHPATSDSTLNTFVTELLTTLQTWNTAIGEAALKVRGSILALSYLFSRLAYRKRLDRVSEAQTKEYIELVLDIIDASRDTLLQRTAEIAIGQLSLAGILSLKTLPGDDGWKKVHEKLVKDAKSEHETPILSLGLLTLTFSRNESAASLFGEFLGSLYNMHEVRSPEVQFTIGEALSNVAVGWDSRALIQDFDVDAEFSSSDVPRKVFVEVYDKIIADCVAPKPSLRKASAIWLLSLVKNCGHLPEMQTRLRKCQATFSSLLGSRDEVVQETGAHGLSLVYEIGDQELKDYLVRDLVDSFTNTGANLGGGNVSGDTQLFEPGALPTGEGTSVNTYKDIMNLAAEAGDPTLVYRFMSMASNNALWSNRAAFGRFGISSIFSSSSVDGYLAQNPKIYPKLFRYRFDPNPNVQRSMNTIWQALVKDPTVVVDTHFDSIMQDLLKSMLSGREWRARQASCTAVADLVSGRRPEKYAQYLDDIFEKAFKLLDDIKESVRTAALKLCQTLVNSVIRTLETNGSEKRAGILLGSAVPFLLSDKGLDSSVEEVRAYAIGALVSIIKKSAGTLLHPFVPVILEKFLGSLSSLEPQAVNYVHLNADKYGLTGQDIDKMRLSSIRTSPMMEVIERYLIDHLDETNLKELVPKLEDTLRSAVGLPSKVGCSRVLVLLSMKTLLFRPYADRFIQLLGKYVVDRNETVSASYCTSMGYLLRLASDDRVLKTIQYAQTLYLNSDDATTRSISAEILYASSKLSNDRFMAFASSALPFVFVCKHDGDEHVRESFEKTWQDNVGGSRAVTLYLREIVSLVSDNLDSARWAIKHTAARAIAQAVLALDSEIDLPTASLVWPVLEKALAGKTWEGKEILLTALVKFTKAAHALWTARPELATLLKTITVREAKRTNAAYRPHGLMAMGEIALVRPDDFLSAALTFVPDVIQEEIDEQKEDKMEIDSKGAQGKPLKEENTLAACVQCLIQCLNPSTSGSGQVSVRMLSLTTVLGEGIRQVTGPVDDGLRHGGREVVSRVYRELQGFFERVGECEWAGDGGEGLMGPLGEMVGLIIREGDAVESVRKGRAEVVLKFLRMRREVRGVPDGLDEALRGWRESERAGGVQQVLDECISLYSS